MTVERLVKRAQEGNPIQVAIVGTGHMGAGTAYQISRMKGMEVVALAERDVQKALNVYAANGIPEDRVLVTNQLKDAQDAVRKGQPVVTENGELVSGIDGVDAVVEATGVPEVGARIAYTSIMAGKHTVMLNIEADVVVGPILSKLAKNAGVVYSIAAGDQPGAICELYDWATCVGFDVVCAGRGTWLRPGGRYLTPDDFIDLEKEMGGSAQMYCSFHDGTKPQIEMAVTANVLGMVPDIRGMHEPFVYVEDLPSVFCLESEGGILSKRGVVDVANCYNAEGEKVTQSTVGQGVFLIVTSDHPGIQKNMKHLFRDVKGAGPNYPLFRPYHLTCIETPYSVIRACLYGETTGAAKEKLVTEVIAVAKKDLKAGEILDGGGGYTAVGMIESADVAAREDFLPLGFAYNIPVTRDIPKDSPIKRSDVEMDTSGFLYKLRALQDES
jgi:predicted homoserine dehydrogenase-like protein